MHVRRATASDAPAIASMAAECFWNDDFFKTLNPYKEAYPDDFRARFLRNYKRQLYAGDSVLVAETEENDECWSGVPEVTGHACWVAKKNAIRSFQPRLGNVNPLDVIERQLLWLEEKYIWYAGLDRSQSKKEVLKRRAAITEDDAFQGLQEYWELDFLFTSPKHQRKGIGGMLIDWGLEKSENDGLPAVLCASPAGQPLYRKKGFKTIRQFSYPIGIPDLAMLWEPRGSEGIFEKMLTRNSKIQGRASNAVLDEALS